jgi:hypothetical protein
MRTLIYARFSSHLQNPTSIEQQIAACRARAAQEGWDVVDGFADSAISGAAGIDEGQRPGLAQMLKRVERARFTADMDAKERIYGTRYPLDEDFLSALAHMPPASGCALGFDRLVMLATGAPRLSDVQWTPPA